MRKPPTGTRSASETHVSIIVVSYNYERFLRRAIESARAQAHPHCEVVVVDDASTDASRLIIAEYGEAIVPVLRPVNGGHSAAMNSGYAHCRGEVVLFLDADDYLYPNAADDILAVWTPEIAMMQSRLDLVDGAGRFVEIYPPIETPLDAGDVTPRLLTRGRFNTTVTSGLAFSRRALQAVMPIPEEPFRRAGDGYLATVAPLYGEVRNVETVIGAYCKHGDNHSRFAAVLSERAHWRLSHDEARYAALRDHAARLKRRVAAEPGLADPLHLEERLVSLLTEPKLHPYPSDKPLGLALHGARSVKVLGVSSARALVLKLWWLACGLAPRPLARALITWKLEDGLRPRWVRTVAQSIRRRTA